MRRLATALLAASLASVGAGCGASDAGDAGETPLVNRCASDVECGSGATCYAGACYAKTGDVDTIVVEVVPDESGPATSGAGSSFLLPAISGVSSNRSELALALPPLANVVGRVQAASGDPTASCQGVSAADNTLSVHVTFARTEALLGLPQAKYALNAEYAAPSQTAPGSWGFGPATIAPGTYDVYVESTGCAVAPLLLSSVAVGGGDVALSLALPPTATLQGTVTPPAGTSLAGWTVDLVEPVRGRVISTVAQLGASAPTNFQLAYRPVQLAAGHADTTGTVLEVAGPSADAATPLIRVRPPKGVVAPTALWDLAAADLNASGHVSLDMSTMALSPVHLKGHLEGNASDHPPSTGAVVLSSLALSGVQSGVTASYSITVSTDDAGAFDADVLPGQYRVVGIPDPALPWAVTEREWQVGGSAPEQAGRTLVLDAKPPLAGRVTIGTSGEPVSGATVSAVASVNVNANAVLDAALGKAPASPRAASDRTTIDGAFAMSLDPGLYDVVVEPSEASGFPWFVEPRALITAPNPGVAPATASFAVPLPVLAAGRATDADGRPLDGALLRAYALLVGSGAGARAGDGSAGASGVVQIAEAHTDHDGRYRLLLPAKITQ